MAPQLLWICARLTNLLGPPVRLETISNDRLTRPEFEYKACESHHSVTSVASRAVYSNEMHAYVHTNADSTISCKLLISVQVGP